MAKQCKVLGIDDMSKVYCDRESALSRNERRNAWRLLTMDQLFFCLIITRVRPVEIMARICIVLFLSAVRAVAARCKHPFALRPGLSKKKMWSAPRRLQRERKRA